MSVNIIARGEEAKKKLRKRGVTPGKIKSTITRRSAGSSKRVTTDTEGNILRTEETVKTPDGKAKKVTFYAEQEPDQTTAEQLSAVRQRSKDIIERGGYYDFGTGREVSNPDRKKEYLNTVGAYQDFGTGKTVLTPEGRERLVRSNQVLYFGGDTPEETIRKKSLREYNERILNSNRITSPYRTGTSRTNMVDTEEVAPKRGSFSVKEVGRQIISKAKTFAKSYGRGATKELSRGIGQYFVKGLGKQNIIGLGTQAIINPKGGTRIQKDIITTAKNPTKNNLRNFYRRQKQVYTDPDVLTYGTTNAAVVGGAIAKPVQASIRVGAASYAGYKGVRGVVRRDPGDIAEAALIGGGEALGVGGRLITKNVPVLTSRFRFRDNIAKFNLPSSKTTTTYVPYQKTLNVGEGGVKTILETVPFKQQPPGYEIPRSRNIFETFTKERQLTLKPGGRDPFADRGIKTPLDDIMTPLQRARRQPGQMKLIDYGIRNPLRPETRYLSYYRDLQARQLSARETQYTINEFGPKITESGKIELNIPKPRIGKKAQSQLGFENRGSYKSSFQDYYTLRVPKPSMLVKSLEPVIKDVVKIPKKNFLLPIVNFSDTTRSFLLINNDRSFKNMNNNRFSIQDKQTVFPAVDNITSTRQRTMSLTIMKSMSVPKTKSVFSNPKPTPSPVDPFNSPSKYFKSQKIPEAPIKTKIFFPDLKNGLKKGFSLEVKNQGVFKKLGKFSELSKAATRGREITEGTSAASLRVRDLSSGQLVDVGNFLGGRYRASKKDPFTFVEKRQYRISTGGEKLQITAKGIAASKNKRRGRLL